MWTQEEHGESGSSPALESPPKKLLFWENNRSASAGGKVDELMTVRIREMEAVTELREMRVRLMELETQVSPIHPIHPSHPYIPSIHPIYPIHPSFSPIRKENTFTA